MTSKTLFKVIRFAAQTLSVAACLDTNLLDDMDPMDTGSEDPSLSGGSSDKTSNDNMEATGDTDSSPPESDPDDVSPPTVTALQCGNMERMDQGVCIAEGPISASFRFGTDETATMAVEAPDGITSAVISSSWTDLHHAAVVDISREEATELIIVITDASGNENRLNVSVKGVSGPPIAITEVLADPLGAEPDQEFVEIVNIGPEAVDLSGWMIDDNGDRNGDWIPSGSILDAGRVALIVSPDFDPLTETDPAPSSDVLIIYLEGSIGSSGLKNSDAESVELYDAAGTLVSAYDGSTGAPEEGISASRLYAELPDGDSAAFSTDPNNSSTPGIVRKMRSII